MHSSLIKKIYKNYKSLYFSNDIIRNKKMTNKKNISILFKYIIDINRFNHPPICDYPIRNGILIIKKLKIHRT